MKATAIPKKVACAASALALSLTMVPLAPMVSGADGQALAAEGDTETPSMISVTAPFKVTFGSKENPYDVNNPVDFMSTSSYFQNKSDIALSVYEVECNAPASYANNQNSKPVVVNNDGSELDTTDKSQKLFSVWDASASDSEAINFGYADNGEDKLSIKNYTLDKFLAVPKGGTTNVNYRLNLGYNNLSTAKIDTNAAQEYDSRVRQDLGTVKFTFGRCAPIGDYNAFSGAGNLLSNGRVFYLTDKTTNQTYSLEQVREQAEDLSTKDAAGLQSIYIDMYKAFVNSDEGIAYECRTKWTVDADKVATSTDNGLSSTNEYYTKEATSIYKLRILDVLYDEIANGNGAKAGITFQFKNAYNSVRALNRAITNYNPSSGVLEDLLSTRMCVGNQITGEGSSTKIGVDNDEYINAMPADMRSATKTVTKSFNTDSYATDLSKMKTMNTQMFLLSYGEILGSKSWTWNYGPTNTDEWPWLYHEGPGSCINEANRVSAYSFYAQREDNFFITDILNFDFDATYGLERYDGSSPEGTGITDYQGAFRTLMPAAFKTSQTGYGEGNWMSMWDPYSSSNAAFDDWRITGSTNTWTWYMNPCFCF